MFSQQLAKFKIETKLKHLWEQGGLCSLRILRIGRIGSAHIHSFVLLLSPPPSLPLLLLRREVVPSGRGRSVTPMDVLLCFHSPCALCDLVFPHVWLCHYVQVCLVYYPHLRSPYKLHSVQCFFVRPCLYYPGVCVCCLAVMDYPYVDY